MGQIITEQLFPFCIATKAQDGNPFEEWDGATYALGLPSKSGTSFVTVFGPGTNYPVPFSLSELVEAFWRIRRLKIDIAGNPGWEDIPEDGYRDGSAPLDIIPFSLEMDIGFVTTVTTYDEETYDETYSDNESVAVSMEAELACFSPPGAKPSFSVDLEYWGAESLLAETLNQRTFVNPPTGNSFQEGSSLLSLTINIDFTRTIKSPSDEYFPWIYLNAESSYLPAYIKFDLPQ